MSDDYNKELCEERHDGIKEDIKGLKNKLWWFNTLAIANLIALILYFVKDMVVK